MASSKYEHNTQLYGIGSSVVPSIGSHSNSITKISPSGLTIFVYMTGISKYLIYDVVSCTYRYYNAIKFYFLDKKTELIPVSLLIDYKDTYAAIIYKYFILIVDLENGQIVRELNLNTYEFQVSNAETQTHSGEFKLNGIGFDSVKPATDTLTAKEIENSKYWIIGSRNQIYKSSQDNFYFQNSYANDIEKYTYKKVNEELKNDKLDPPKYNIINERIDENIVLYVIRLIDIQEKLPGITCACFRKTNQQDNNSDVLHIGTDSGFIITWDIKTNIILKIKNYAIFEERDSSDSNPRLANINSGLRKISNMCNLEYYYDDKKLMFNIIGFICGNYLIVYDNNTMDDLVSPYKPIIIFKTEQNIKKVSDSIFLTTYISEWLKPDEPSNIKNPKIVSKTYEKLTMLETEKMYRTNHIIMAVLVDQMNQPATINFSFNPNWRSIYRMASATYDTVGVDLVLVAVFPGNNDTTVCTAYPIGLGTKNNLLKTFTYPNIENIYSKWINLTSSTFDIVDLVGCTDFIKIKLKKHISTSFQDFDRLTKNFFHDCIITTVKDNKTDGVHLILLNFSLINMMKNGYKNIQNIQNYIKFFVSHDENIVVSFKVNSDTVAIMADEDNVCHCKNFTIRFYRIVTV